MSDLNTVEIEYKKLLNKAEIDCQLACNLWLEEFGFTTRVDSIGTWGYAPEPDVIEIQLFEEPDDQATWDEFVYERLYCPIFYSTFFTSFLHELGHAQTIEFFTEDDIKLSRNVLSPLEYFETPVEIAATRWAIDFMKEHKEKVDLLVELICPLLEQIDN